MRDDEGLELANAESVRLTAGRILIDLAKDEFTLERTVDIEVNVRDGGDFGVFSGKLTFATQWYD